jgi:hypothetical protein
MESMNAEFMRVVDQAAKEIKGSLVAIRRVATIDERGLVGRIYGIDVEPDGAYEGVHGTGMATEFLAVAIIPKDGSALPPLGIYKKSDFPVAPDAFDAHKRTFLPDY